MSTSDTHTHRLGKWLFATLWQWFQEAAREWDVWMHQWNQSSTEQRYDMIHGKGSWDNKAPEDKASFLKEVAEHKLQLEKAERLVGKSKWDRIEPREQVAFLKLMEARDWKLPTAEAAETPTGWRGALRSMYNAVVGDHTPRPSAHSQKPNFDAKFG